MSFTRAQRRLATRYVLFPRRLLAPHRSHSLTTSQITISTTTKKNTPIYNLSIVVQPKRAADKPHTYTIAKPFAGWFDEVGFFVAAPFQEILASAVPLIGTQDPKRVKASQTTLDANPDLLDAVLAASSGTEGKGEARQRKA